MPLALMLVCIGAIIGLIVGIFYAVVFGSFLAFVNTIPKHAPAPLPSAGSAYSSG